MAYKADFKTTFEPSRVIQPIYEGGSVALSENGRTLATTLGEEALLTDLSTGAHLARIEGDGELLTTLVLTPDASYIAVCSRSLSMRIYALEHSSTADGNQEITAKLVRTLKPHNTPVVTIASDSTSQLIATGGADGEIKVWDVHGGYVTHTFHGHSGVISALHFFQVEAQKQPAPTNKKKRRRSGADVGEDAVATSDKTLGFRLASGGEDGKVRIWDLHRSKSIATLDSHVSVVRALSFSPQRKLLLSASRDRTAILWDATSWKAASTVAVLESVEAAGFVAEGGYFYTGGETARVRIWSTVAGSEASQDQPTGAENEDILDVLHHPALQFLLTVHADQTLVMHSLAPLSTLSSGSKKIEPLPVLRRISGTHDEIIDLAYIGRDRNLLALATNAPDIRIITLDSTASLQNNGIEADEGEATSYFGADVALLKGHSDIIITLDVDWSGHWLATGAKDNTAKLWRLDIERNQFTCYATFSGHAESISAVSLPSASPSIGSKEYEQPLEHPPKFLITGSSDKTVKRWNIASEGKTSRAAYTRKAHDRDINAIATSFALTTPLFASSSQDRTVKIWDAESGEAIGVLRGHKRGVWTAAFSPLGMPALTTSGESGGASTARGMVVTGSTDKTVKIWSLTDYSCLRTFEGHANSVLKVVWLPPPDKSTKGRGVQVASAAGDGLVKVWDAQESECAATLDNHIDRVWALAVKPTPKLLADTKMKDAADDEADEETDEASQTTLELVSGSADSTLTFWTDTTHITAQIATSQATARIEQDQELQNHIQSNNYREAIVLALQLNHPKRLLDLFTNIVNGPHEPDSFTGKLEVDTVLGTLSDNQLWSLLRRLRDWNANGRTSHVAQRILYAVQRIYPKERLLRLQRRQKKAIASTEGDDELNGAMAELSVKEKAGGKESVKDVMDALKAYTERHYTRHEKTGEERFVLLWMLQQMDDVSGEMGGLTNGGGSGEDVVMLNGV